MSLFTINVKPFKKHFYQILIVNIAINLTTLFLIKNGIYLLSGFDPGKKFTLPFLFCMVITAFLFTHYRKKDLKRIQSIENFPDKVAAYESLYKERVSWYFFSNLLSCVLAILTGRMLFYYYSIADLLFYSHFIH
jgi:hypothetical protein